MRISFLSFLVGLVEAAAGDGRRARPLALGVAFAMTAAAPLAPTWAQSRDTPRAEATAAVGFSTFIDEDAIEHVTLGGSVRIPLSAGWSIEPRFIYMRAGGRDQDFYLIASFVYDMEARGSMTPFLTIGGGIFWHRSRFGRRTLVAASSHLSGGGGVRVKLTDSWSLVSEARFGLEPIFQVSGGLSYGF